MKQSEEVKQAMLAFYEGISKKQVERFDDIVSKEAKIIIGTAPGEWVTTRAKMRFGFEAEGLTLTPGKHPQGYEEGQMGWAVDEPIFGYPDGSTFQIRLTMIMRKEDNRWKIVHGHFSVGVPDELVAKLQKEWSKGK